MRFHPVAWFFTTCLLAALATAQPAATQSADIRSVDAPDWMVHTPASFGFDRVALSRAFTHAENLAPLNSLIIARRDTIVAEAYYRGMGQDRPVNIKSASKSVLSALVGIALEEGHLDSLNQPIAPFFPEYLGEDVDPQKRQITVRDLLTMRAGLASTSSENYGAWVSSDNWVRYVLEQPMVNPPGVTMDYSTGNSHLISAILTKATGTNTRAYAQSRLFAPLGIHPTEWQRDPQGIYFGGNNMMLSPHDLLKFGQLYLNGGRHDGQQIVPEEWTATSTQQYVFDTDPGFKYGYFWWTETFSGVLTHFAWGYGGQYVFVIPALDMVVVCTSSLVNQLDGTGNHNERIHDLLANYILPAARP